MWILYGVREHDDYFKCKNGLQLIGWFHIDSEIHGCVEVSNL
jgi:hypothetical protein